MSEQVVTISPASARVISGLLSLLIMAFGGWAAVVWNTGQTIAATQAEQLSLVRLNEVAVRHNERRVKVMEEYLTRVQIDITRLREQMAVSNALLVEIKERLSKDQ